MAARLVRGACPHDCPDTCAMHVTVEDGRATRSRATPTTRSRSASSAGRSRTTSTASTRSDRILHPLVREDGGFRRASWDEALDRVAEALLRVRDEFGGESILPYSYMGTQGLIQGNTMSARVMNALGASALERTICATAGITGTLQAHGVSPEVDPEEWPNARFLLIWGWNPLSTAPHLWRKLLDARSQGARLVVVDPFRSRTARLADEHLRPLPGTDAALAIGMMRAIVDAGLHDDEWCRAHTDGYDELLDAARPTPPSRSARRSAGSTPRRSPAWVATSPPPGPRCCGSAWAPSATPARRPRTPRSPRCRSSPAPGGIAAAASRTSRQPRPGRSATSRSSARTSARLRCGRSTCRGSARRSPTRRWTRR